MVALATLLLLSNRTGVFAVVRSPRVDKRQPGAFTMELMLDDLETSKAIKDQQCMGLSPSEPNFEAPISISTRAYFLTTTSKWWARQIPPSEKISQPNRNSTNSGKTESNMAPPPLAFEKKFSPSRQKWMTPIVRNSWSTNKRMAVNAKPQVQRNGVSNYTSDACTSDRRAKYDKDNSNGRWHFQHPELNPLIKNKPGESVDSHCPSLVLVLGRLWLGYAFVHLLRQAFGRGRNHSGNFMGKNLSLCYFFRQMSEYGGKEWLLRRGVRETLPELRTVIAVNSRGVAKELFGWAMVIACLSICQTSLACDDIRGELWNYPCLDYDDSHSTFSMACSFEWSKNDTTKCIILKKDERFEGNGFFLNLTGISDWKGLFKISSETLNGAPSSLDDAPRIHDLHMIGGETSVGSGFIIQSGQTHFIVETCSSSGVIQGDTGGGICGNQCSGDILISHSWSTGEINGSFAGGIAGRALGMHGNIDSTVTISNSYSTGDIIGTYSGGICGGCAGWNSQAIVIIDQCYSLGEIGGSESGGITGVSTACNGGHVSIANCYSRGNITGTNGAGGMCGRGTASGLHGGTVILTNVYASGLILDTNAGALIGHIHQYATEINITMSVYTSADNMVGDNAAADKILTQEKNSHDLNDITGTIYCYDSESCWDTDTVWAMIPSDDLPILQFQVSRLLATTTGLDDIGRPVQKDVSSCLHYDPLNSTFSLSCSFNWTDVFDKNDYIRMYKGEVFEGNGYEIGLFDIDDWEGLVKIENQADNAPSSLTDAPRIYDIHMLGGETSFRGGFLVQAKQNHFIVKACSSSGVIRGTSSSLQGGGGICGEQCSGDISITSCWSTGEIRGVHAGGIAGMQLGLDGDTGSKVTISHCYSTGEIAGPRGGGICGMGTGWNSKGKVVIKQCYSVGNITGSQSGGIAGSNTAQNHGRVSITNCFSRGDITGIPNAGGICGSTIGTNHGTVSLTNVYASGHIIQEQTVSRKAGGLIGRVHLDATEVKITMSVYNGVGDTTANMIGWNQAPGKTITEKTSSNLDDITSTVYCHVGESEESCWDTETIWEAVGGGFPILQNVGVMTPNGTTSSASTPSVLPTSDPTRTSTGTGTSSPSRTTRPNPTQRRKREQVELPVQYPPRSVFMMGKDKKTKR